MYSASELFARTCVAAQAGAFPWALAACALIATTNAGAHEFCVSNAADLEAALAASSDGGAFAGENNDIGLLPGTYMTSGGPFHYTNATRGLTIIGGYDVGSRTAQVNRTGVSSRRAKTAGPRGVLA